MLTVARGDPDVRLSMGTWVERNARRHRDAPALYFEDATWTWRELNAAANRWASALRERGVSHGDAVVLLMESRPELLFAVVGLAKLGAAAALVNTSIRGDALRHCVEVVAPKLVLVGDELAGAFGQVRRDLSVSALRVSDPWAPSGDGLGADDLVESARWAPITNPGSTRRVRLGDRVFTIPTSGTTGLPKASVMSHMRWVKAADTAGRAFLDLRPGEAVYSALPFFHNMSLTIGWGAVVAAGAALAMRRKLSISEFWADCRRYGVVAFPYIGELPRYLLSAPPSAGDRDHGVRAVVGVGMRADVWSPFADRFGIDDVFEMYSASEANTAFVNPLGIRGSVGFCPGPHALLAWDGERGEPRRDAGGRYVRARRGEAGLLIAKVSPRYPFDGYTDPAASEKKLLRSVFRGGDLWVDTGDLLRKIGWGHAVFVDRVGDTFRWRSENVSTLQVERSLNTAPGVRGCAVVGVEVPGAPGRAGLAAVVASGGLDIGGIAEHLFAELPEPAVPVFLRAVDALETTGTHKPRKGRLRAEGWEAAAWVRLPRTRAYVPLTEAIRGQLRAGSLLF